MTRQDDTRLAIVSGGTRGIGLAISRRLCQLGYRVVALYATDDVAAKAAARTIGDAFGAMRVDVADESEVDGAILDITSSYGPPHVLVNNAGINRDGPFLEMSSADWRRVLDVNLTGAFLLSRAVVPHLLTVDDPVIVNVAATTGIRPRRNGVNYCASKAGLLQLTQCLALELAPKVRVNALIPGMTETEELVSRFRLDDPTARAAVLAEIPRRRLGTVDDLADALEFLIGPQSQYVIGQKLIVDGGQFMW